MAIKEVQEKNGVRHVRETQREHRTSADATNPGRYVPPSELAEVAGALTPGMTQTEIAGEVGEHQPTVHEALKGRNTAAALRIIEHYAPEKVEGPLYFVPNEVDDLAGERRRKAEKRE